MTKKRMNKDEQIAEKYLKAKDLHPKYEPDGNIPPDFSVIGKIGVEVRRLNQSYDEGSKSQGLEEVSISLESRINQIFQNFQKQDDERYWIELEYKRPINISNKQLRSSVRKELNKFLKGSRALPARLKVTSNLVLNVLCTSTTTEIQFNLGAVMDDDAGGWTISVYCTEIERCIAEKADKIKNFHSNYNHWWLLLIDHIGLSVEKDIPNVLESITKLNSWDRIIVLSRTGVEKWNWYNLTSPCP